MSKKSAAIVTIVSLSLAIVALVTTLIIFIVSTRVYATQLENVYMRSFYELSSNINDLEVNISKLIATNSEDVKKDILTDMYNICNVANTNISNLPLSNNNVKSVNEFINRLGGFSYSLIEKINKDVEWSEGDITSVGELHSHALNLLFDFNSYISTLSFDFEILSQIDYKKNSNGFSDSFDNIQSTNSKVPTLIYDGPFADSVLYPSIKGLPETEVTKEEAEQLIIDNFVMYNIKNIKFLNEATGLFTTYNFKVEANEINLYVQITKKGGLLLEITSSGTGGNKELSVSESKELSKDFAKAFGFEDMYAVWSTINRNVIYVNLAPIVSNTIYYPDLIKVKVDRSLGLIAGWEAKNYCYNHTERTLPTPTLTLSQAQAKVSSLLTINEKNRALIPNKFSGETLAYEFVCSWKDYTYYVYIDCVTGKEVNILRVIKTNSGDLIL